VPANLSLFRKKRKGEIPFETSPSAHPIFEDLVRKPDHDIVIPEFVGTCELASAFPSQVLASGFAMADGDSSK
jgi:hypothetical protein